MFTWVTMKTFSLQVSFWSFSWCCRCSTQTSSSFLSSCSFRRWKIFMKAEGEKMLKYVDENVLYLRAMRTSAVGQSWRDGPEAQLSHVRHEVQVGFYWKEIQYIQSVTAIELVSSRNHAESHPLQTCVLGFGGRWHWAVVARWCRHWNPGRSPLSNRNWVDLVFKLHISCTLHL